MTSVGEELNCGHPPVVHGNSSSACFSRNCASGLKDAAVGSGEEQLWISEEQNSQVFLVR